MAEKAYWRDERRKKAIKLICELIKSKEEKDGID